MHHLHTPVRQTCPVPRSETPRHRRIRRGAAGIAISGVALLGGALVAGVVADAVRGCGAPDPTDPINATTAVIVNNTPTAVRVADCAGTWCQQDRPMAAPGDQVTARAACGMVGSEMTSYRISTTAGVTLGYIAVRAPRSDDRFTYEVSRASPRRDVATTHS